MPMIKSLNQTEVSVVYARLFSIAGVDENIGFLLDYLKETGLDKNTIVMYSADQGFYLEHGWFDKRFCV